MATGDWLWHLWLWLLATVAHGVLLSVRMERNLNESVREVSRLMWRIAGPQATMELQYSHDMLLYRSGKSI